MTLPVSGQITMQNVLSEYGFSTSTQGSLYDLAFTRTALASPEQKLTDLYSHTGMTVTLGTATIDTSSPGIYDEYRPVQITNLVSPNSMDIKVDYTLEGVDFTATSQFDYRINGGSWTTAGYTDTSTGISGTETISSVAYNDTLDIRLYMSGSPGSSPSGTISLPNIWGVPFSTYAIGARTGTTSFSHTGVPS
jgi:hypothetical protein